MGDSEEGKQEVDPSLPSTQNSSRTSHAKMIDPVYDEIDRILIIVQNEDGSWGTSESLNERIYPTAWVFRALSSQGTSESLAKASSLLRHRIVSEIEGSFNISNFAHVRKLCGLVMLLSYVFENELWDSKPKFIGNLRQILDYADSRSWVNSLLAGYASHFLREVPEVAEYAHKAKDKLGTYKAGSKVDPFAALGSDEYLSQIILTGVLLDSLPNMPDEELAHLLVALAVVEKSGEVQNKPTLERVKDRLIATIQKRQLTELDRQVSREMLDILLLLRARISKAEIQNRLKSLGSRIYLKDIESSGSSIRLVTEIPSGGLPEILGRIDLVTLSAYVWSVNRLKEKVVHIVPQRDYERVRSFFETNTLPIPSRRVLGYELVLGLVILSAGFAFIVWLGLLLSDAFSSFPALQRLTFTITSYASIFLSAFALLGRLMRNVFPELASSLGNKIPKRLASGIVRRILVGK